MGRSKNSDTRLSKFISLVLRHQPQAAGIELDSHGWADVEALLAGMNAANRTIDRETLERIVREDRKGRYAFDETHTRIRANQGHSLPVDLELLPLTPPEILYHGTAKRFLASIQEQGICAMSRQYVHLSLDLETAQAVGRRHGEPAVLVLDSGRMDRDGVRFYRSENGVWLTRHVDWTYVKEVLYP